MGKHENSTWNKGPVPTYTTKESAFKGSVILIDKETDGKEFSIEMPLKHAIGILRATDAFNYCRNILKDE